MRVDVGTNHKNRAAMKGSEERKLWRTIERTGDREREGDRVGKNMKMS